MNIQKQEFTVGELAKATGLTVRTLQHYDNIGLLPASGRTDGGRRFYTDSDMLKLEQIVFYKSLGISLTQIGSMLVDSPSLTEVEKILVEHERALLKKIEALHTGMSVINASLTVVRDGKYPPWEMLIHLIRIMESSHLEDWAKYQFDEQLKSSFAARNMDAEKAMEIYHAVRDVQIEAATLNKAGHKADSPEAQDLAKRWWELIVSMTNGDASLFESLSAVNQKRDTWPEADRKLFDIAEPFIEAALGVYIENNNIEVPSALLEGKKHE